MNGGYGRATRFLIRGAQLPAFIVLRSAPMSASPRADRLLAQIEQAHAALIAEAGAEEAIRRALAAIRAALAAGMDGIDEERLSRKPDEDEWSMAEVVEHIAEHDRKYGELAHHGAIHYVEHGLEHALQLWWLRSQTAPPD